jgi:glycosyltransferase involved in cell wall biosynthesis
VNLSAQTGSPLAAVRRVAIVPAFNEERNVGRVLDELRELDPGLEVVVVSDGSTDRTVEVALARGAHVIRLPFNLGIGGAVQTGFRFAWEEGYELAVRLDGDGQHDPAEIPRFLAAWAERPDLVVGRRNYRAMPPARRLSNELGRLAFSWAVGREIPDNQSGYRLVSRRLAEATLASDEPGFAFEVEQITSCIRMGGTIAWVPIRTIYAGAPSHIRPITHLREFVRIVRQARRDVRTPLG